MSNEVNGMSHREKVDHLIADLGKRGVSQYTVAPPAFRLLWALGIKIPPPFFMGFGSLTLLMGVFFGVLWGVVMWFLQWQTLRLSLEVAILAAAGAGLLFGLLMAAYYRWKANQLQLPTWENYP